MRPQNLLITSVPLLISLAPMFQTSAWRATSRSVVSPEAPIQIGGCGFWTGFGFAMASLRW